MISYSFQTALGHLIDQTYAKNSFAAFPGQILFSGLVLAASLTEPTTRSHPIVFSILANCGSFIAYFDFILLTEKI